MTTPYRPNERQVYIHPVPKGYTNDLIQKGLTDWPAIEEVFHTPNLSWANITLKSVKAQKKVLCQPGLHVLDGKHQIVVKPFTSGGAHAQDTWYAFKPGPSGGNEMSDACKLFVGGIPYDFDEEDVRKAIQGWGKVVHVSIPPTSGAAFITLATPEEQRLVLQDKSKHKIGHKFVDVKPYQSKATRRGSALSPGLVGGTGAVPKASQASQANTGLNPENAVKGIHKAARLVKYVGDQGQYGIVEADDQSTGIFHANSVYVCRKHRIQCSIPSCPDYRLYSETEGLRHLIPVNTRMSMVIRKLELKSGPYAFQVMVAWPSPSNFPSNLVKTRTNLLDDHLMEIMSHPAWPFKANMRERAASLVPNATPRAQRRRRNQSASNSNSSVASCSIQTYSSDDEEKDNPERDQMLSQITDLSLKRDDLMRYLAKIRKIKEFLQEHFSHVPVDNILCLAQKIMQVDVKKRPIVSSMLVSKFIKSNNLTIGEQKLQNIMALFKVLLHPFAQESEIDGKVAEKMADREHIQVIHQLLSTPTPSATAGPGMRGAYAEMGVAFSLKSIALDSIDTFNMSTVDSNMIPKFNEEVRRKFQDIYDWVTHYYKTVMHSDSFKADDVGKAVVNSLSNVSLPKQELIEDKKLFLTRPLVILGKYAGFIDTYFNPCSHLMVSRDFVIKAFALYFWNTNPFITELGGNSPRHPTLSSILSATVISESMLANVRGIVIQYINKSVGLIVTPFGKVLFDIRFGLTRSNEDWIRCTHPNELPVGSMVKLHCMMVEDNDDKKMTFLVAFKLWPIAAEDEPCTGLWIVGGYEFWKASLTQFIKLVKANPALENTKIDQNRKKNDVDLYNKCFEHFMRKAFDEMKTSSAVSTANLEVTEPTYKTAIAFFQKQIDNPSWLIKVVNTVKVLALRNISLHDLRKCFMAAKFLGSVDLFTEALEMILFSPGSSIFYGPNFDRDVCNIADLVKQFFETGDPVVEGQISETQKKISNNPIGSKMRIANLLEVCNCLNPSKLVSAPLMMSEENEPTVPQSATNPNRTTPVKLPPKLSDNSENDLQHQITALQTEVNELRLWKEQITQQFGKFGEDVKSFLAYHQQKICDLEKNDLHRQAPKTTPSETTSTMNVKVVLEGHRDIYSFPLSEDGNLPVSSIAAVFPNVSCLMYVEQSTGHIHICAKSGNIFCTPEGGWGHRIYSAKVISAPQLMNGIPPFPMHHPNPQNPFDFSRLHGIIR